MKKNIIKCVSCWAHYELGNLHVCDGLMKKLVEENKKKNIREYLQEEVMDFLRESNAIEGVHDKDSLDQARHAWEYLISKDILTTGTILKTHKILMIPSCLRPDERGYFRRVPVYVGGREGIKYEKIPGWINDWMDEVNSLFEEGLSGEGRETYWEEIIRLQHVAYEKIHPFVDGNGRTGRMFMNWTRLKLGLPILIIKADERGDYYQWFRD